MSTISNNRRRDSKARDPTAEKSLGNIFSCDGGERDGFGPAGGAIDAGEEVGVSSRWW